MGFLGANVTIPLGTRRRALDELSPRREIHGKREHALLEDGIIGGTRCGTTTDPTARSTNLKSRAWTSKQARRASRERRRRRHRILASRNTARAFTIVCRGEQGERFPKYFRGAFPHGISLCQFQRIASVDIILERDFRGNDT